MVDRAWTAGHPALTMDTHDYIIFVVEALCAILLSLFTVVAIIFDCREMVNGCITLVLL